MRPGNEFQAFAASDSVISLFDARHLREAVVSFAHHSPRAPVLMDVWEKPQHQQQHHSSQQESARPAAMQLLYSDRSGHFACVCELDEPLTTSRFLHGLGIARTTLPPRLSAYPMRVCEWPEHVLSR